jgi:hypothetical protein
VRLYFSDYGFFAEFLSVEPYLVVKHQKPTSFEVLIGGFHVGALLFSWTLSVHSDVDHAPNLRIKGSSDLKILVVDALPAAPVAVN